MDRTSTNSKTIYADRETVYKAFAEKEALEYWQAPDGMRGKIHNFDFKVNGKYEMSLFYNDGKTDGKTSGNEDRFLATFKEIKPNEKIVQAINFQSDNNEFKDEMIMEVHLETIDAKSTKVTITFKNIPLGIDPKDNEDGTEQSLSKLAEYVQRNGVHA